MTLLAIAPAAMASSYCAVMLFFSVDVVFAVSVVVVIMIRFQRTKIQAELTTI